MSFDLIITNARLPGQFKGRVDVAIAGEKIAAIAAKIEGEGQRVDADGGLLSPGFVETHIHLDKSCVIDRCTLQEGTLQEAIRETARVKKDFSIDDIAARARLTLEKAILAGTQHMRTHVEIDPRIGLKGFHAVRQVAKDYAWAINVQVCVFPQEGLINDPGCEELIIEACHQGADLIGGCPYADTDPYEHIARIFNIALRFDLDIDFHLDFDLDTSWMHLGEVCRLTRHHGYQSRVTVGHVTKLSALPRLEFAAIADDLALSGVAVTVLPATDLFLMGRDQDHNVPRGVTRADRLIRHGVTCSLATNNVLNAFTPFGDCSLCRMANLYANIAQLGRPEDLAMCMDMVTHSAARLMKIEAYGIACGNPADFIILPAYDSASAIAEIAIPRIGVKNGRVSFNRPAPLLHRPKA